MRRSLWLKCGANQCDKAATLRAIAWFGIRTSLRELHAIIASSAEIATPNSHHQRLPGRQSRKRKARTRRGLANGGSRAIGDLVHNPPIGGATAERLGVSPFLMRRAFQPNRSEAPVSSNDIPRN
ncbi:hypothetical protein E0H54_27935 [Rhizobium leguminosarum bv. viciae]|nr:hypothetical protein E0H54_27935 [Rhizobium leguminosarum bv. viciae]